MSVRRASGGSVFRDHLTSMDTDAGYVTSPRLSGDDRWVGSIERTQLKIARTLGLSPASLNGGGLDASRQTTIDSGISAIRPGQVPAEETLALVYAFNRIKDPEVRRSLLQKVEAAANGA